MRAAYPIITQIGHLYLTADRFKRDSQSKALLADSARFPRSGNRRLVSLFATSERKKISRDNTRTLQRDSGA